MTKEIKTEILIHSAPEKVWKILTNFEDYPHWNPFIKFIKGEPKEGNKITARIEPPESNGMTFKPKILKCETNTELTWLGHFLLKGLFDGEHTFRLVDNENGTTTFQQNETFKGLLVPLFEKQLENNTKRGFQEMNKKLKKLAEQYS